MLTVETDPIHWEQVRPNFIYNRPDLWNNGEAILYHLEETADSTPENGIAEYLPVWVNGRHAEICAWQMKLTVAIVRDLARAIFETHPRVSEIRLVRAILPGQQKLRSDIRVDLPESEEELDQRCSSKMRYNRKRERRIASEEFGSCELRKTVIGTDEADKLLQIFLKYKEASMGIVARETVHSYQERYHLSHVYELRFGEHTAAILTSCEQCEDV